MITNQINLSDPLHVLKRAHYRLINGNVADFINKKAQIFDLKYLDH